MIENIHTIIAAAAVKFSSDQLNHLFVLIQKVSFNINLCSLVEVLKNVLKKASALHTFISYNKCKVKCVFIYKKKKRL